MSEPGDVARPPRPCSKGVTPLPHLRENPANPVNPVEKTKRPHSAKFAPPAAHLQTRARASKTAPTRVLRRLTPPRTALGETASQRALKRAPAMPLWRGVVISSPILYPIPRIMSMATRIGGSPIFAGTVAPSRHPARNFRNSDG